MLVTTIVFMFKRPFALTRTVIFARILNWKSILYEDQPHHVDIDDWEQSEDSLYLAASYGIRWVNTSSTFVH